MKVFFSIIFSVALLFSALPQTKGHLVIIGGGNRTDKIMAKIIELAGGKNSKVMIIPNASSDPEGSAKYLSEEFENLGCNNVDYIVADSLNVNEEKTIRKLADVKCVFFSGGDQNRLTKVLLNSKLLEEIRKVYESGGVISGTSAGAAVMSRIMITGDELLNNDTSRVFNSIMKENIKFTEGFGFINNAIVDQHFIRRKRNNRLISLVLEHPENLGIGIDESTAAIVYPDNILEVIGENQVVIYDASKADLIDYNYSNNLAVSNMIMHILISGQRFDLLKRSLIK